MRSTCILSNDFSKITLRADTIRFPETGLNGEQIKQFVTDLKDNPKTFATCSLFLIRELEIQKIPCLFVNDGELGLNVDDVGSIEILDRSLEQSDRYLGLS